MDKYLKLKAELLVEGVNATPEALKGLGGEYKEQNHGLFGWDFEDHINIVLPDDFVLPNGTLVQFRRNSRSPYLIITRDKRLVLTRDDEEICQVKLEAVRKELGIGTRKKRFRCP